MDLVHSFGGGVHAVAAVIAIIAGAFVLLRAKGAGWHRYWGRIYFAAMAVLLLAGATLRSHGITPFHILSIVSAVSLLAGMAAILMSKRTRDPVKRAGRIFAHYKFMTWSYVGLIAAGFAQLASRLSVIGLGAQSFWLAVLLASMALIGIGAWLIRRFDARARRLYAPALTSTAA